MNGKPITGTCVDVGTHGNPGICEYRGVDIATGKELFHYRIPGISTNNIGEFLAICQALHTVGKGPIYTDSTVAMAWFKKSKCNTNFNVTNEIQKKLITQAEIICSKANKNMVFMWHTKKWGQIPADFGRKNEILGDQVNANTKDDVTELKNEIIDLNERIEFLEKENAKLKLELGYRL